MINEETTELDRFLSKEYKLKKYQDLKKLKGVDFNERMKLEFALRDPKNIKLIKYLITVYEQKKDNNELDQSSDELLKVAQNINFFSVNISDMKFYEHELISDDLREIFKYLIERKIKINKKNTRNYVSGKIEYTISEETLNDYEHYFYSNKLIDNFEIKNSYFYNSLPYLEETKCHKGNLEKEIEESSEKYYENTNIKLKSKNIFVNNINLEINLAMPETELTEYIKKLSKLYKNGEITKEMIDKETFESVFSVVGIKYLTNPEEFLKLLFIYDMHHNENANKNVDKLFKALSKQFIKSANRKEELSQVYELSDKTIRDLSSKFSGILEKQLYLQL